MRFQTFIAPNLQKAKEKVIAELGEEAVIIATRDAPGGGVEIRAAAGPRGPKSAAVESLNQPDNNVLNQASVSDNLERRHVEETLAHLRGELARRKTDAPNAAAAPAPELDEDDEIFLENFRKAVGEHGLGHNLITPLALAAMDVDTDDNAEALTEAFAAIFKFAPLELAPLKPIMLVGPTGAGKTSSAAKLAARAIVAGGHMTLMSADVGRAGAVEQISTYADALDAPFFPVESPTEVSALIRDGRVRGGLVLDTPGISPFDKGDMAAVRSLMEAADAEPVLVLPATGDAAEHLDWARAFAAFGVKRCIITKFDAAKRVGAALGAAYETGLALAHFSDAAFIAEGLRDASATFLGERLLSAPGRLRAKN